jgi:hypothetical protein
MCTKLVCTRWSNIMHILLESSYIDMFWWWPPPSPSRGKTTPQNKRRRYWKVLILSRTHCHYFAFPFNTGLFMSHLPPMYVPAWSAVPSGLEVPLGSAHACANQQNALTSCVHCSSISCPFTWYSCIEEQCIQEVNSLYRLAQVYAHPNGTSRPNGTAHHASTWEGGVP